MASASHQYPGVNLPLRHLKQQGQAGVDFYRCGSFKGADGTLSQLIQVREMFMMMMMDRLTDKPNWHEKVFNDAIVTKWRIEALAERENRMYEELLDGKEIPMPVRTRFMDEATFDYVRVPAAIVLILLCFSMALTDSPRSRTHSALPSCDVKQPISKKPAWS